ncbi:MAG: Rpn family recombination-promoting nuclease/putative transposase [Treponema sp.]|jgi:predicted transposase/invertase (TIGR01784 family)|nr:Rpn family recombination-promoting nuclease/putative transposase [Treponema sp.]
MTQKILRPKIDFVFKLLFGDTRNTDILEAFLKAALDIPGEEYRKLVTADPFLKRENEEDKTGILDVKVYTTSGMVIDVEIQLVASRELRNRIVLYAARMLTEQLKRGADWAAGRVISIIIVDDILVLEEEAYYNKYGLNNKKSGKPFTGLIEINILELPKLPREDNGDRLWAWGQFLKAEKAEEFAMVAEKAPEVKRAVARLMELSEDERNRMMAEKREIWLTDMHNIKKESIEKGLAEGRATGLAEGRATGRAEAALEIARKMKALGDTVEKIMQVTGFSREVIENA